MPERMAESSDTRTVSDRTRRAANRRKSRANRKARYRGQTCNSDSGMRPKSHIQEMLPARQRPAGVKATTGHAGKSARSGRFSRERPAAAALAPLEFGFPLGPQYTLLCAFTSWVNDLRMRDKAAGRTLFSARPQ